MRKIIGFSHIVIESKNINYDLNSFLKIGYKIKFDRKNLNIPELKKPILLNNPSKVRAIFLEKKNNLNIELIQHNKQITKDLDFIHIGTKNKSFEIKSKYHIYDKSFNGSLNILIESSNYEKQIEFFLKEFEMKKLKIKSDQKNFFKSYYKKNRDIKLLETETNIFFKEKIYFFIIKSIHFKNKKNYLNETGISCLSFIDLYKSINFRKYEIKTKTIPLNIKETKIKKYYFLCGPDKIIIEILHQ